MYMQRSKTLGRHLLALAALTLSPLAFAATTNVNINSSFTPNPVVINVNDSVKWTWVSNDHNTVSQTPGLWDSGIHNAGFTFTHTFPAQGQFSYACTVHGFTGTVTVKAATISSSVLSAPKFIPPSTFQFNYSASSGASYVVQRSANLSSWVSLKTNVAGGTSVLFQDTNAPAPRQFYHVFQMSP